MYRVIQTLLFIFFISSCSSDDTSNPPIQVNLVLRDTFTQEANSFIQGEDIEFYLTITNTTNEPITLNFNDGQQFDFYITSSSDIEIWRWSANKGFIQVLTFLTIPAQGTVEVTQSWDQALLVGGNIAIGSYTAFGSFLDQSPTAQFSFTIQ